MKNKYQKIIAAVLSVFILALFVFAGFHVIRLIQYLNYDYLIGRTYDDRERYVCDGGFDNDFALSNTSMLVYDIAGNRHDEDIGKFDYLSFDTILSGYLESVSESGEVYTVIPVFKPRFTFIALVGISLEDTGSFFLIRELETARNSFLVFAAFCGLIYAFVMAFICYSQNKQRAVEQIYRTYVSNVSHTLKSPVSSIQVLTEALSNNLVADQATRSKCYGIILAESQRLERSVEDIIKLSKLQDGRQKVTKWNISAAELFCPCAEKFAIVCEDIGAEFVLDSSIHSLPELHTDPALIEDLLDILFDNAIKFIDVGDRVKLSAVCGKKRAVICLSDTGPGISRDDIDHIFERFYRASNSYKVKGSGLGLAIAKEIVSVLGEKIWVESSLGKGSEFSFTVKIKHGR